LFSSPYHDRTTTKTSQLVAWLWRCTEVLVLLKRQCNCIDEPISQKRRPRQGEQ
jgi:hypothetical protein